MVIDIGLPTSFFHINLPVIYSDSCVCLHQTAQVFNVNIYLWDLASR
jgi:hypothetical protein